jgi:heptosyltransferase-3
LLEHTVLLARHQDHAVIEKLRLLEPWGLPQRATLSPPAAEALPADVAAALRSPYVVVHVPSLVRYKQWPVAHFAALVQALVARDVQVALSGGPSDADRHLCAEVARIAASPRLLDLAGRLSLAQMATLLQGAAAYVGPDTSITHLAAACGTPVIALYGPISPRLWGPWPGAAALADPYADRALRQAAGKVVVLQGPPPCVPCNQAGCENHVASRSVCLEILAPARVADEALRAVFAPAAAS